MKNWNQPKCPPKGEYLNESWNIYIIEFHAVFKMNICIGSLMLFISEQQKNMLVRVLCFLGSKFEMGRLEKNGDSER